MKTIKLYYTKIANIIISKLNNDENKKYIFPLDFDKDYQIIESVFLEPISHIKTNFNAWDNNTWIESMQYVKLGMLSFLYKNKASLLKIYNFITDPLQQCELMINYQKLIKYMISLKNLSKLSNYIIQENIEMDEIQKKKFYLYVNIKNFKNPKFFAYLFDVLTYKTFRINIFKSLIDKISKIDIENITSDGLLSKENFIEEIIEYIIENDYFYLFANYIMMIDFKGDIVVDKSIQDAIIKYTQEFLQHSSKINIYLDDIINKCKNSSKIFKSNINLIVIDNYVTSKDDADYYINNKTNKFEQAYLNANNIKLDKIDLDTPYKQVFINNETIKFTKKNLIDRILSIVYLIIEYIKININKSNDEKINNINSFIHNNINLFSNFCSDINEYNEYIETLKTSEFIKLNKNNNNTNVLNFLKNYSSKIIDDVLENTDFSKEDLLELQNIFKKHKIIFNMYKNINFSETPDIKFTLFSDLLVNLTKNKKLIKIIILEFFKDKHIEEILTFFENRTIFQLNEICKKKILEIILQITSKIVNMLKTSEINPDNMYIEFDKFIVFIGNILDSLYVYIRKYKPGNNQHVKVKQSITYAYSK